MTLRELIRKAISLAKMKEQSTEDLADTILDAIDQYGFELDEWREDTDIKQWISNLITETSELPIEIQAMGVIYRMRAKYSVYSAKHLGGDAAHNGASH